ncbi:uncharacterized protein PgNI_11990 [Pyricularia grisea]|uniref:Uncharacterized protein n=1 Tax=Pyricularia grisea TaxID=148305 RepID=A0A6P8AQF6_PYRGI|nr:uncharacterized protein PgNI_11990 [Pyricularia grisea]TLD04269.1 hypothetical protein PgNI_11990 [Pyricularia grisea]
MKFSKIAIRLSRNWENLLFGILDKLYLAEYGKNELRNPTPRKTFTDRIFHVFYIFFNIGKIPHFCNFNRYYISTDGQL